MSTPTASSLLADPERLAERLGVSTTDPRLVDALRSATARFRAAVRHPVSLVEDETITLDGTGTRSLLLPAAPVTSVAEVLVDDEVITDYRWSPAGMLRRPAGWPDDLGNVTVTYSHGYDPIPEEIADAVLSVAEATFDSAGEVAAMTVGGQQVTFREGTTRSWATVVELYRLNRGDQW